MYFEYFSWWLAFGLVLHVLPYFRCVLWFGVFDVGGICPVLFVAILHFLWLFLVFLPKMHCH